MLAAGTISFFGGKRLVLMPLIRPSTYSDKDLQELCDTLADTENAIFVLTSIIEESYGKLRPGKREQSSLPAARSSATVYSSTAPRARLYRLWPAIGRRRPVRTLPRCRRLRCWPAAADQFLLKNEVKKLAALANYSTITKEMVSRLGTVTLDADTFDMVKLLTSGQADKAQQKLKTLLALQNEPIMITGALISNYLDLYRVLLGRRSRRGLGDVARTLATRAVELPPQFYRKNRAALQACPAGGLPAHPAKTGHRPEKQQAGRRPFNAEGTV